jgi:hypothetical protein
MGVHTLDIASQLYGKHTVFSFAPFRVGDTKRVREYEGAYTNLIRKSLVFERVDTLPVVVVAYNVDIQSISLRVYTRASISLDGAPFKEQFVDLDVLVKAWKAFIRVALNHASQSRLTLRPFDVDAFLLQHQAREGPLVDDRGELVLGGAGV